MVQRQDIDALLISALYGELTPAEEKQLTAHLETHPGDRSALDGLTRARAALHESRILAVQLDPPHSVSALLLQEAHRRAPKSIADGEGWFARFLRSFVQHPALAAAAMLVIVIGFAAIVGRNKGSMSAEQSLAPEPMAQSTGSTAPAMDDQQFVAPAPAEDGELRGAAAGSGSVVAGGLGQGAADGRLTDSDAYKVDLAQPTDKRAADPERLERARDVVAVKEEQATRAAGVVVKRKSPAPMELDAKPKGAAVREDSTGGLAENEGVQQRQELAYGASAGPGAPPAPPATSAPARPVTVQRELAPAKALKKADSDDAASIAKDANADKKAGETKSDSESAWARQQHQALIAAVKSNDCPRAANVAVAIEQRAPGYYAANVATDRGTKDCRAYIAQRREQNEASDRAKARSLDESPSSVKTGKKAAPAKAKASAKPAATESK